MADRTTIARPYAKAAFAEARAGNKLGPWSEALRVGAAVVQDERIERLLDNPAVTSEELAQLVIDISGARLDEHGKNFVRTLAENGRLGYLPEVAALFEEMKAVVEGVIDVTVTSAAPLDQTQQLEIASALSRKLKRQVRLQCELDPSLIGGAVLRAGDLVIDGSLRARLTRIAHELTS